MTFRQGIVDNPPSRHVIHLGTPHKVVTIVAETLTWHGACDRYNGSTGEVVGYVPERLVAVDLDGQTHTIYPA